MNILFLVYHGFSEASGISKKIKYQIKGLRQLGHRVYVCTYCIDGRGHRVRYIDDCPLQDFGTGRIAALRKRCSYGAVVRFAKENGIEFVYARSFHNANPFTARMFRAFKKAGIKSVIEIPTYPYDQEYTGFSRQKRIALAIDKIFRNKLAQQTDAIVTFTQDKEIFGQRTICISNGIDPDMIPLKEEKKELKTEEKEPKPGNSAKDGSLSFIGVAEVHYWHGFDRFIAGMGEYYKNGGTREMTFHIVGGIADCEMHDSEHAPGFAELAEKYNITDRIVYHGQKFGAELDAMFDDADFAVASLGRHRSGITHIKTLKNREYAARGLRFIYSETDDDFDSMPYIVKAPADESPVDINKVIDFIDHTAISPKEIRDSIDHLTWKRQMETVIRQTFAIS